MDMFAKSKFHIGNTSNFKSPASKINNVLDQPTNNINVLDHSPKHTKNKSPYHLTPIHAKNRKFTEDFITRTEKTNGFASNGGFAEQIDFVQSLRSNHPKSQMDTYGNTFGSKSPNMR